MEILCLIPARSGSKGVPHKNIRELAGKPLIAWSIEQAKQSKHKMRIIVSTDSEEYCEIAKRYGAETPFLRPKEISQDLSTDLEFIEHALGELKKENYFPDFIVQLRPTYPTRTVKNLDETIDIFIENRDKYDSLRTVISFEKSPYKMYRIENNILEPLFREVNGIKEPYNQCRQNLIFKKIKFIKCDHFTISKYMSISDLIVVPSIYQEQYGRVIQEGVASGSLVIGSNVGAIPEIISDKDLIFERENHEALAILITKLNNKLFYKNKFKKLYNLIMKKRSLKNQVKILIKSEVFK